MRAGSKMTRPNYGSLQMPVTCHPCWTSSMCLPWPTSFALNETSVSLAIRTMPAMVRLQWACPATRVKGRRCFAFQRDGASRILTVAPWWVFGDSEPPHLAVFAPPWFCHRPYEPPLLTSFYSVLSFGQNPPSFPRSTPHHPDIVAVVPLVLQNPRKHPLPFISSFWLQWGVFQCFGKKTPALPSS